MDKDKKNKQILDKISLSEGVTSEEIIKKIKEGKVALPLNRFKKLSMPCAIGEGLRTKVNVNIGSSQTSEGIKEELKKLKISVQYGADTVMDLSTGRGLKEIRKAILDNSPIPLGTVPVYEAAVDASRKTGRIFNIKVADLIRTIERQAKEGVDFFTIHCGLNVRTLQTFYKHERVLDVVSRGGAILIEWMTHNKKENPLYEYFDEILDIARNFGVVLSLGDCFRPGSVVDATDGAQIEELIVLAELTQRAREKGVQIIIEGPGHVPLNQIEANVVLEKKICKGAPFYVLGPLVTDIAPGYDHITGAIGAACAAYYGTDLLCYVTPAEHLRLPTVEDVKEGLIAFKIAAHAGDLARGRKDAFERDKELSLARKRRDWKKQIELSLDPEKAKMYRSSNKNVSGDVCSMCNEYCSIKIVDKCLRKLKR